MRGGVAFLLHIFFANNPRQLTVMRKKKNKKKRMVKVGTYMHLFFLNALFANVPNRIENNEDGGGKFDLTKCVPGEMGSAHNP